MTIMIGMAKSIHWKKGILTPYKFVDHADPDEVGRCSDRRPDATGG